MTNILKLIAVYLFALLFLSFLLRNLRYTGYRWFFVFVHGALLAFITIGCSNNFPLFLSEQAAGLSLVEVLRPNSSASTFNDFVDKNNLLLVDVSQDLQLLQDPVSDRTQKAKLLATDRKKLTSFLNQFISDSILNQNTDLIVCDILLDAPDSSHIDAPLSESIKALSRQGKLLLAESVKYKLNCPDSTNRLDLRGVNTGLVDIDLHDGLFFNYTLIPFAGKQSLAYKMYSNLYRVEADVVDFTWFGSWLVEEFDSVANLSGQKWAQNTFIPDLLLSEQDAGNGEVSSLQSAGKIRREPGWLSFGNLREEKKGFLQDKSKLHYHKLGLLAKQKVTDYLDTSRKSTVVFIGLFADEQRDMHQTAFGNMHGSLVQLNVFFNLIGEANLISPGFVLYLLLMFSLLTWVMLRGKTEPMNDALGVISTKVKELIMDFFRPISTKLTRNEKVSIHKITKQSNFSIIRARVQRRLHNSGAITKDSDLDITAKNIRLEIIGYIHVLVRESLTRLRTAFQVIVIDQLPYWILFSILCISSLYFNHIVNIMGLTIYTAAVDLSLKVLAPKK